MSEQKGDGVKYTFGDSKAAMNLMGDILEKEEYKAVRQRVLRLLSKQFAALTSIMAIPNKGVRETTLKMWHDRFDVLIADLPETVKSHVRCVETGLYRSLVRISRKEEQDAKQE